MKGTVNLDERPGVSESLPLNTELMPEARQEHQPSRNEGNQRITKELTDAGVLALMKMFIAPLPNILPDQVDSIPYQTERVRSKKADAASVHSPWTWMERVRIYGIRYTVPAVPGPPLVPAVDLNVNNYDISYRLVKVYRTMRSEMRTPSLSTLASTLKSFLAQDIDATKLSNVRVLKPVREFRDLQSMATLLTMLPKDTPSFYDEAPLLRMALLMNTMVSAETIMATSSLVQQTFVNCVPGAVCEVRWAPLPADNTVGCRQPNEAAGTTQMFAATLDSYLNILTGKKQNAWAEIGIREVVVVPVKAGWNGENWLIPYILAFTTTAWWNFGRIVDFDNIRTRAAADQIPNTSVRGLVDACTVVVPGRYSHIVLVIIDAVSNNYSAATLYNIGTEGGLVPVWQDGSGEAKTFAGFSTAAYTWLGRVGANAGDINSGLVRAWNMLCETVSLPGMENRIRTMASELSYTRRTAGTLAPGFNPGQGVRRHNGFLALTDAGMTVDGTNFLRWEINRNTAILATGQIRAEQTLRHSSCGLYPASATYIGSGAGRAQNIPCFNMDRYASPQYQVNQSAQAARVSIAIGLLVSSRSVSRMNSIVDFNIYTEGQSSLMLGMAGWAYSSTGLAPNIASGYVNLANMSPEWCAHLLPTMTDQFAIDPVSRGKTGIGIVEDAAAEWNVSLMVPRMNGLAGSTVDSLNNLSVPFWYVMAILNKFQLELDNKTSRKPKSFTGVLASQGRKLAYCINQNTPWYALHLIMSDLGYEDTHWDFAAKSSPDEALARQGISWFPDRYFDMTRHSIAQAYFDMTYALPVPGVIQTTLSGGDYMTQYIYQTDSDNSYLVYYIWGRTAVEADRKETWPTVIGGLYYPDIFLDWLWEGAQTIGPHLLTGNYGMAAAEAFKHLASPAVMWAGDKVKTWVENRTQ